MSYLLGRVRDVQHDPRSLAYAVGVLPKSAIKSVRWTRRAPVFDQGSIGSCTGNAAAGLIGTDSALRPGLTSITVTADQAATTKGVFSAGTYTVDENLAVRCYTLNTLVDSYPGSYPSEDTGSDGLAAAKTLQSLGAADTYKHAFSLSALDSALQAGPVMLGTEWLNSMFNPANDGRIPVTKSSGVAGGHEYIVDEIDVANGVYWMQNSWSTSWGVDNGRGYITRSDMQWLLSQQGDVTAPHMLAPVSPTPPPAPTPTPSPAPAVDPDVLAAYNSLSAYMKRNAA